MECLNTRFPLAILLIRGIEDKKYNFKLMLLENRCTYTVNVATLAYERRIRGVYQATRLTIISAWFHTSCWVLSTLLALLRVLLAVDFKLVRVSVQLRGNIDRMLVSNDLRCIVIIENNFFNLTNRNQSCNF